MTARMSLKTTIGINLKASLVKGFYT
jgi:hypothetical protein